ncbi:hypothetical protein Tco_0952195 [Tanacetum coccineum]|uniref:Uncharacterized protein n=1 Tax=Tanacetum coccineum TaxID=301880 RepID=A0ABQ5DWN7_9ASTR
MQLIHLALGKTSDLPILHYTRSGSLPVTLELGDTRRRVRKPEIKGNIDFEIKGRFLRELRDNTFSGNENEDAYEHMGRILEIASLFKTPGVSGDAVMLSVPSHTNRMGEKMAGKSTYGNNKHMGLETSTRQMLDSRGPILGLTVIRALVTIQEMADHSYKWHEGRDNRECNSTRMSTITEKLKSLNREIHNLKENVYTIKGRYEASDEIYYLPHEEGLEENVLRLAQAMKTHIKLNLDKTLDIKSSTYVSPLSIKSNLPDGNNSTGQEFVKKIREEDGLPLEALAKEPRTFTEKVKRRIKEEQEKGERLLECLEKEQLNTPWLEVLHNSDDEMRIGLEDLVEGKEIFWDAQDPMIVQETNLPGILQQGYESGACLRRKQFGWDGEKLTLICRMPHIPDSFHCLGRWVWSVGEWVLSVVFTLNWSDGGARGGGGRSIWVSVGATVFEWGYPGGLSVHAGLSLAGDVHGEETGGSESRCELVGWEIGCTERAGILSANIRNSQVKDNKIDLLVQQYEQFVISEDESIDSAFARFNTIITSLKALDEGYSSNNYHRETRNQRDLLEVLGAIAVKKMMNKIQDETCLVAQAPNEVCSESSYFSDENSSIDDLALDNEYDKLCKMSLMIITKNKRKIKESLNVTFDETPPPSKTSPLVDDDLDEEEAIREIEKKNLENVVEDETLEIDEICQ